MKIEAIVQKSDREALINYLEQRILTDEEMRVLIKHAPALLAKPERDMIVLLTYMMKPTVESALFAIGLNSSLHISELLQLRFADILEASCGRVVVGSSVIDVNESVILAVRKLYEVPFYRVSRETEILRGVVEFEYNGKMIQRDYSFNEVAAVASIRDRCCSCGIEGHFGAGTLRKSFGVSLLQNGENPNVVRRFFDKRTVKSLEDYLGFESYS